MGDNPGKLVFTNLGMEQMQILAQTIASIAPTGSKIALAGAMGSGKTAFLRHFFESIGRFDGFRSPTYSIINTYEFDEGFFACHIDAYRLQDESELLFSGFDTLENARYIAVEWSENVMGIFSEDDIFISLSVASDTTRNVTIKSGDCSFMAKLAQKANEIARFG
ncbi:MAG: tRNA (adenosine(37)-N6)-threonylcarbamoyltransferase complex ATPase subunit type 1 TsaE [Eubacteriaceae bacterium]|nr:tRNA (adenosine(37)-N6)-threonylcarbamoyltransferase complex ATPase subunit type 1 TsaE [Eubacteriaceae bacterium]